MLQQTQVKTVIPYFNNFTKKFKTLHSLSKSNEKEILKMWEGLGYYRRARNLLACSKELVKKYNSKLPNNIEELKKLPGIGDYTSNALLGLVHNKPTLALDGNVKRVFSRILNIEEKKINLENRNLQFKIIKLQMEACKEIYGADLQAKTACVKKYMLQLSEIFENKQDT